LNGVIFLPKSILGKIVILCIILLLFFLYKLYSVNRYPFDSEQLNESKEEMIGHNSEQAEDSKGKTERKYQRGEFQAGINLLVYEHPNVLGAQKLFMNLRSLGVNSVAIVFPLFQSGWQADRVMVNPEVTATVEEIKALILSAHAEDLSVMIRPILDEKSLQSTGHWRGTIKPQNTAAWFESYLSLLLMYAELAQEANAEIFSIGTELNSLQQNEYSNEWLKIIEEIGKVYKGDLIYSFNWDCFRDIPNIKFVSMLDYVGIDAYFPLNAPDDAALEELEEAWEKLMSEIKEVLMNEAIVVTEAGIIPVAGAYHAPYSWSIRGAKLDRKTQINYYKATFSAWQNMIQGIYWWCVTLSEPDPGVIDYSPLGTPTEEVIKEFYLKNKPEGIKD